MKNKIKQYVVSSADWELVIDGDNPKSAAISAIIMAFKKFGKKLLMSTTIMVRSQKDHILDIVIDADFFATHSIFEELGMHDLAKGFKILQS